MDALLPWLFVAVGLFSLVAAVANWEWFFGHRKAALFVRLFGRTGGRAFYALLGLALIAIGVLLVAGVLKVR